MLQWIIKDFSDVTNDSNVQKMQDIVLIFAEIKMI